MKHLNKGQLWDFCRGMTWVWDYCRTGTSAGNARGVQEWVERGGEYTASLQTCRAVAARIKRYNQGDALASGIGVGFGQSKL